MLLLDFDIYDNHIDLKARIIKNVDFIRLGWRAVIINVSESEFSFH